MIGERNNRSLVGNNGSPAENNGSYSTRGPMKIEGWKRYFTIRPQDNEEGKAESCRRGGGRVSNILPGKEAKRTRIIITDTTN